MHVPSQDIVMYVCVRGIDFACFYDFVIGFWSCSKLWYFLFYILLAGV